MALKAKKISTFQIIILGFIGVILLGTFLLMLPFASQQPGGATLADALFTATSAGCVTGLIVQDTATYWTGFGQAIILCLIQIGGLGVVTVAVLFAIGSGRKIGLMQRSTLQDSISARSVGGILRLTVFILKVTLTVEGVGALLLLPVFWSEFGFFKGLWYSVFHAVSAFCNAGFDLMGINGKFGSLTTMAFRPYFNIVVMLLIVLGGIGFLSWDDFITTKMNFKRFRMQTKVILITSGLLILIPAIYFFLFEYNGETLGHRTLLSLFQSVTTRTAGFNTADLTQMSESGLGLMIALMLVGGSPGSTAGGLKTTTLAVLFASAFSTFARRKDTHLFNRRIDPETVRTASALLCLYIVLFMFSGCLISGIEHLPLITCLFETASAVGTVGITLGVTPSLSMASRAIIVVLMFIGRVGGLTLIYAYVSPKSSRATLPLDKITIG